MPSRDILDKLFDVEREAEGLVAGASAEASRRVSAAKEKADIEFRTGYEAAAKAAEESRRRAEREAESEHDAALAEFRSRLEATRLDREAFDGQCMRLLPGKD